MLLVSVQRRGERSVAVEVAIDPDQKDEREWVQSTIDGLIQRGQLWGRPMLADDPLVAAELVRAQKLGLEFSVVLVEPPATSSSPGASADVDATYFSSYSTILPHEVMLKDQPRTLGYRAALDRVARGKRVLDVGCGTGVLSIFAAKAGATHVTGVEASDMANMARAVVMDNDVGGLVTVEHSRVEDLDCSQKYDVIVSEWMGFYLLHESMLESVLWARTHLLSHGGLMLPNTAVLLACPVSLDSMVADRVDFFRSSQYGLDLSRLVDTARESLAHESPHIVVVPEREMLSTPAAVTELDLATVSGSELAGVQRDLTFTLGGDGESTVRGMALWFTVGFPGSQVIGTGPEDAETHWKQTVVALPEDVRCPAGSTLRAQIGADQRQDNRRHYQLSVKVYVDSPEEA